MLAIQILQNYTRVVRIIQCLVVIAGVRPGNSHDVNERISSISISLLPRRSTMTATMAKTVVYVGQFQIWTPIGGYVAMFMIVADWPVSIIPLRRV